LNNVVRDFLSEITQGWSIRRSVFSWLSGGRGHHCYSCTASSVIEKPGSESSLSKPDPGNGSPPTASSNVADKQGS
jgi:hypothetical protein